MPQQSRDFGHEVRKHDSFAVRAFFGALGGAFLAAGAVGIFIPVLPTVPLWLVAAACFARSSTRLYNWLLNHRQFGHGIREWRHHRSIPYRAKRAAIVLMALSFGITVVFLLEDWPARIAMAMAGLVLGGWLWRLPSRDDPARRRPDAG